MEPFATANGLRLVQAEVLIEVYVTALRCIYRPCTSLPTEEFRELESYCKSRYLIIGELDLPEDMLPYFTIETEQRLIPHQTPAKEYRAFAGTLLGHAFYAFPHPNAQVLSRSGIILHISLIHPLFKR